MTITRCSCAANWKAPQILLFIIRHKEHFQSTWVLLSGTEPTGIKQKLLQRRKWKWFKNQTNTTLQKRGFLMMTLSYHGYIVSIAFLLHSVKGSQFLILAACFFVVDSIEWIFFWMNILDFVLNEYFFEWIFWILFWIESFLGQIQRKNEFSKRIEQG